MTNSITPELIHSADLEQASNSYLMAIAAVIAGLPLPIINTIASIIYYIAHRQSSYFVRWHCIQSILAQAVMVPFNSIAFAWTLNLIFSNDEYFSQQIPEHLDNTLFSELFYSVSPYYWMYITVIIILNVAEFITVLITATQVRKGKNLRLFVLANIADALTNKENRDPYIL
jgi:uncharacterized membrane protein